jgi:hypothetical protein
LLSQEQDTTSANEVKQAAAMVVVEREGKCGCGKRQSALLLVTFFKDSERNEEGKTETSELLLPDVCFTNNYQLVCNTWSKKLPHSFPSYRLTPAKVKVGVSSLSTNQRGGLIDLMWIAALVPSKFHAYHPSRLNQGPTRQLI